MPWNGSGVFSRLYSWVADAANGVDILASRMDQDSDDIASGLGHCLTVNGETVPTANLRMNGFTVTGLAPGVGATDAVTLGQLQNGGGGLTSGFMPLSGGTVTGNLSVGGTLTALGAATVGSTLSVNGTLASFAGAISVAGNINGGAVLSGAQLNLSGQGVVYSAYGSVYPVAFAYNSSNGGLYAMISGSDIGQIQITPSDARLKRNIEPATLDALAVLGNLQLYAYDRLDPVDGRVQHHEIGFVAQELQGLIPEAVTSGGRPPPGDDPSPLLSLDLMPLVAYAVRAIQQLQAELSALRGG